MSFLKEIFDEINLKNIFVDEQENAIKPFTVTDVLGNKYKDLYKEQEKWLDFCYGNLNQDKSKVKVRVLLTCRDYGKTDIVGIYGIVTQLKVNPSLTFIIGTRKEQRAKQILQALTYGLKNTGFQGEFNKESIRLACNKSKYQTVGIANNSTASIRGLHIDCLIADDLVISSDEYSEVERRNTIDFFKEALNVTKNIIILGQPVHEEDLYAFLEKIVNETNEKIDIEIFKSPHESIPELDKDLDSLRTLSSERDIQKNYNLELIKEGLYPFFDIPAISWQRFSSSTYAVIDPAFGGEDNIGIAIGCVKQLSSGEEKIYAIVKELKKDHKNPVNNNIYAQKVTIIKFLQQHNVERCYIESNDNNGVLNDFKKDNNTSIVFRGFKSHQNKQLLIRSRISRIKNKVILNSRYDTACITNWNDNAKHDDGIDALGLLGNFLTGNKEQIKVFIK